MTTKDYIRIARVLRVQQAVMDPIMHDHLVSAFVVELKEDNPRFNEELFKEACRRD